MKLIYLDSSKPDLAWLRTYYGSVFSEGSASASARYIKTIELLQRSPYIGRPVGQDDLRRLPILRTPFTVFYRVIEDRIEIVRVWDQRADPEKLQFNEEAAVFL
jgi:plasmid stabilization system protein ParE